ncbi:MAG: carbon-nitrogen hydrolase [Ardenticatenales bacterium]|nr:carbon-nitrogen hydrolase [Ardenticatenales bacterium]
MSEQLYVAGMGNGAPPLRLDEISSFGHDQGCGNFVAVQTFMQPADYGRPADFAARLHAYLAQAAAAGWLNEQTIVAFPEHIGTWLVAAGEPGLILRARSVAAALMLTAARHPVGLVRNLRHALGQNRLLDALFRFKAPGMAAIYQATFADLARSFGVTLVAGSLVLPEPEVEDGRLVVGRGGLQNVTAVFRPDGTLHPHLTRKVRLVHLETAFLQAASPAALPVYETPAGRLGILICADSWYPETYAPLAAAGVELLIVPNFQATWDVPWPGYAAEPVPADVDSADVGRLLEKEAWLKYALPGRLPASGARYGLHVFGHGQLWDERGDGQTIIVTPDEVICASYVAGAALVNFWLGPKEEGDGA